MHKRFIIILFFISQLFLTSCSPELKQKEVELKQKEIELPYYGVFIVSEGNTVSELVEIKGKPNSYELLSPGVPAFKQGEELLILAWYPQINLNYFMFGLMEPYEEELPYNVSPWNEEILRIIPSITLTDGVYCLAQGDPLASPISVPFWCFRIGDNAQQELQGQEEILQEESEIITNLQNVVRVMDYCSIYGKSPIEVSRNDEVVIFDGWMAKEQGLVDDHVENVILDVRLDGENIVLDSISEILPDYDSNNNIEGYDIYFEKNIGKLLPGTHLVEAVVSWKQKIFDGWAYYGPGTKNETIEGYCEIIIK